MIHLQHDNEEPADDWEETRRAIRTQMLPDEQIAPFCRRVGLSYIRTWEFLNRRRACSINLVAALRSALGDSLPLMPWEELNLLTATEAAAKLGITGNALTGLARRGAITPVKAGRNSVTYRRSDVEAVLSNRAEADEERTQLAQQLDEDLVGLTGAALIRQTLQAEILRSGGSIRALARRLRVSHSIVRGLLDGDRGIHAKTARKLLALFPDLLPAMPWLPPERPKPVPKPLTTNEVSELLRLPQESIGRLTREGELHPTGRGKGLRYERNDVDGLLNRMPWLRPTPPDTLPEFLTSAEARNLLGISKSTFYHHKRAGRVTPAATWRSDNLYRRSDLEAVTTEGRLEGTEGGDSPVESSPAKHTRRRSTLLEPNAPARMCACGCKTPLPKTARGRFIQTHHMKLAEYGAVRGVLVTRHYPKPPTPEGELLRNKWRDSGLSGRAFAQTLQLNRETLTDAIGGVHLRDETLAKIQAAYPDEIQRVEMEQVDGRTSLVWMRIRDGFESVKIQSHSDILREQGKTQIAKMTKAAHTPEALARASATKRNQPISARVEAKPSEIKEPSPAELEYRSRLKDYLRSPSFRAIRMLNWRLKRVPSPDPITLSQWADECVEHLRATFPDLTRAMVLGIFDEHLTKKGLKPKGPGRDRMSHRLEIIDGVLARHKLKRSSAHISPVIWNESFLLIQAKEQGMKTKRGITMTAAKDAETIRKWWFAQPSIRAARGLDTLDPTSRTVRKSPASLLRKSSCPEIISGQ